MMAMRRFQEGGNNDTVETMDSSGVWAWRIYHVMDGMNVGFLDPNCTDLKISL